MKKVLICLLCAVLLCGLFACGTDQKPTAPEEKNEPIAEQTTAEPAATEPGQTAAPEQTEAPVFSEDRARSLSLTADAETRWQDGYSFMISVFADGTAILDTRNEMLWLTEDGDSFRAEVRMYRTPYDEEPAYRFPAGSLKLLTDGEALKVEVRSDPLGILSYIKADGRLLEKHGKPYAYPQNRSMVPQEPNTKWFTSFEMAERSYAWLNLTVGNDISFAGTLTLPDGTKKDVALLGCWDSFALVEEHEGAAELLFYGERTNRLDSVDWYPPRVKLVRFDLEAIYDPLGLCHMEPFTLFRLKDFYDELTMRGASEALRYMPGVNLDTVMRALIRDGWTDRTDEIETLDPILAGWFAWLTRDGQTLLIYYEPDFTPYGDEDYLSAYVLYDADGNVLDWSGSRPIDHTIADGFTLEKDVYFEDAVNAGIRSMDVAEDDYAYFTDDGRIAIETVWHEGVAGDLDFRIVRVIP